MRGNQRYPPGPAGNLIFGHFTEYRRDPLGFFTRCAREYGDVTAFRLPGFRFYLLSNPEDIGRVFAETNTRYINHTGMRTPISRMLFGTGLLTSEGDEWKRQRRLAFPSFHHAAVARYLGAIVSETSRTLDAWDTVAPIDLLPEMTDLSLRTLVKTLIRTDLPALDEIPGAILDVRDAFMLRNRLQSLGMFLSIAVRLKDRRAIARLNKAMDRIIVQRRTENSEPDDLLSVLMNARYDDGTPISDHQLKSELKTFFFTGLFGIALPLSWSLYLVAQNADVHEKLAAEALDVLSGREPELADIKRCTYAANILKEAIRLYPLAWFSGREAVVDTEIGGYFVPKGTQIISSQWVTHRDPRFWPDPERFVPERWAVDRGQPKYSYFPLGGGPRFCLGDAFAEMMAVIVLTMVSQRFRLRPLSAEPVSVAPYFALFPKRKLEVTAEPRTGRQMR